MKKVMFLMAIAGMFAFAACNNNPATTENVDTPAVEQMVEEPVIDSNAVEAVVDEAAEVATEVAE